MESKAQLRERGFVVHRGLLDMDEVRHYTQLIEAMSGMTKDGYDASSGGRGTKGTSWNLTDGVTKTEDFWPLISHDGLISRVKEVIGSDAKYLQHSDLQFGFSAVSWHRDNVSRTYGVGPDWDESEELYQNVRVGIYLQSHEESGFALGFIPGSHTLKPNDTGLSARLREARFAGQGALAYLSPKLQKMMKSAEWVATEPGDAIIFDVRILHSGSYIHGPKLSMFVGYGVPGRHFADLRNYYRFVRPELGYGEIPPALQDRLRGEGLLAEDVPEYTEIPDAWTPMPIMKRILEKRLG